MIQDTFECKKGKSEWRKEIKKTNEASDFVIHFDATWSEFSRKMRKSWWLGAGEPGKRKWNEMKKKETEKEKVNLTWDEGKVFFVV